MLTPVFHKTSPEWPWPTEERAFYLLTGEGLFFCRNHPFFKSCVPAPAWPAELAAQSPFLRMKYPRLPQSLVEKVIGFFSCIGEERSAEAAVVLAWNLSQERYELVVPEQQSVVGGQSVGRPYPIEVHYQIPRLPTGWLLVGDIHSHVNEAAYSSVTDQQDEMHRPGVHIVVGRLNLEPPDFHIEVTVDGFRFRVGDHRMILEGYERRRTEEVPSAWLAKVQVYSWSEYNQGFGKVNGSNGYLGQARATPLATGEDEPPFGSARSNGPSPAS